MVLVGGRLGHVGGRLGMWEAGGNLGVGGKCGRPVMVLMGGRLGHVGGRLGVWEAGYGDYNAFFTLCAWFSVIVGDLICLFACLY